MTYDRQRLLDAIDLPTLADDLLGRRSRGRSPSWPCPERSHVQTGRTPPLTIFMSRQGDQRWKCHGCGASGTAIDLVMAVQRSNVKEAIEYLAARSGLERANGVRSTRTPNEVANFRGNGVQLRPPEKWLVAPGDIDRYVAACERWLWASRGAAARTWLTRVRRLEQGVLKQARVGFDPGPRRLDRPEGLPRASGVVLPVLDNENQAVFTQTRRLPDGGDGPRYLNCAASAAANPRIAFYRPAGPIGSSVVVCEGAIDALSVVSTGRRAAAVLSASIADDAIAKRLVRLRAPLVLAFDADPAGDHAAGQLIGLVQRYGGVAARLRPPPECNDLNGWMNATISPADWTETLNRALRSVIQSYGRSPPGHARELGFGA